MMIELYRRRQEYIARNDDSLIHIPMKNLEREPLDVRPKLSNFPNFMPIL